MKQTLAIAAILFGFALPVWALDLTEMTDDDRAVFRDEVRAYLLENPEIIIEAMEILKGREAEAETQNDVLLVQNNATELFDTATDWVGGNKDGDITIVEFFDYQCSYCRKAHAEVAELITSDGNIRIILKEYPILGENSDLAARFAISVRQLAGDESYKTAHDALMTLRGDISAAALSRIATDLGLDPEAVNTKMLSDEVSAVIAANRALGDAMQVDGTPTFIVDQTMLRGYAPLDGLRQIVADERKS